MQMAALFKRQEEMGGQFESFEEEVYAALLIFEQKPRSARADRVFAELATFGCRIRS